MSFTVRLSAAHIDAFTSKVALLRKLPDDWVQKVTCGFRWASSLLRSQPFDASGFSSRAEVDLTSTWRCLTSIRRPAKSLNILHHLLKKLTGWVFFVEPGWFLAEPDFPPHLLCSHVSIYIRMNIVQFQAKQVYFFSDAAVFLLVKTQMVKIPPRHMWRVVK